MRAMVPSSRSLMDSTSMIRTAGMKVPCGSSHSATPAVSTVPMIVTASGETCSRRSSRAGGSMRPLITARAAGLFSTV